jgi:hypothetical protein
MRNPIFPVQGPFFCEAGFRKLRQEVDAKERLNSDFPVVRSFLAPACIFDPDSDAPFPL